MSPPRSDEAAGSPRGSNAKSGARARARTRARGPSSRHHNPAGLHTVEVLHGVNLNMLGVRDPLHYGTLTLAELEDQIAGWASEVGLSVSFFQTNAEGEYVERLHALRGQVGAVILNPGSWTHYAYAIHDALELTGLKAVEVHLSDVAAIASPGGGCR